MDIDFDGSVQPLQSLPGGDFFAFRDNERTMLGFRATYNNDVAAVLLNTAVRADEPFPCVVTERFFSGANVIRLGKAILVPDFTEAGFSFRSEVSDGPGTLFFSPASISMRVARRVEGFFYVDVATGLMTQSRPGGIEVPRWSIRLRGKAGLDQTIINYTGPRPV